MIELYIAAVCAWIAWKVFTSGTPSNRHSAWWRSPRHAKRRHRSLRHRSYRRYVWNEFRMVTARLAWTGNKKKA